MIFAVMIAVPRKGSSACPARPGEAICLTRHVTTIPRRVVAAEHTISVTERLTPADLDRAAELLRAGRLVAFPTETVYGLGADATNESAVAAIFAAKARPRFNPLIIHVIDEAMARPLVVFDARAGMLAKHFWPGPLTLVLPRAPGCPVPLLASAGLDSLAVRVPAHPLPRALIRARRPPDRRAQRQPLGAGEPDHRPACARRARRADRRRARWRPVPRRAQIDGDRPDGAAGGAAAARRPGRSDRAAIGPLDRAATADGAPRSPGLLASHYAPCLPLRLERKALRPARRCSPSADARRRRPGGAVASRSGDLAEAAVNLFAALRALDRPDSPVSPLCPFPSAGSASPSTIGCGGRRRARSAGAACRRHARRLDR